jgi:hypothetical protein
VENEKFKKKWGDCVENFYLQYIWPIGAAIFMRFACVRGWAGS